jgi:hypothetical protein
LILRTDSETDSDVNSGTDSETIIGANPESIRIGEATPEQELHQNRSKIVVISANQMTINSKIVF